MHDVWPVLSEERPQTRGITPRGILEVGEPFHRKTLHGQILENLGSRFGIEHGHGLQPLCPQLDRGFMDLDLNSTDTVRRCPYE